MRMRLNRPWATTRGARAPAAFRRARNRSARRPARAGDSPPSGARSVSPARQRVRTDGDLLLEGAVERAARPDAPVELHEVGVDRERDPVRGRHDRRGLLRPHHRARPHGVDPFLGEADRERLGLAAAARRERRVETRALQGAGEVAFALAVPHEPDQHVGGGFYAGPHSPIIRPRMTRSARDFPLVSAALADPAIRALFTERFLVATEIYDDLVDAACWKLLGDIGALPGPGGGERRERDSC